MQGTRSRMCAIGVLTNSTRKRCVHACARKRYALRNAPVREAREYMKAYLAATGGSRLGAQAWEHASHNS
eukprot:1293331-Prymnesium_polylepis.1